MVDFASALRRLGGDRALYAEVALLFASDCLARIEVLRQAVIARDWEAASLVAHNLRGGFATVGDENLRLLSEWIETSCGACDPRALLEAVDLLEVRGALLIAEVKAYSEDSSCPSGERL